MYSQHIQSLLNQMAQQEAQNQQRLQQLISRKERDVQVLNQLVQSAQQEVQELRSLQQREVLATQQARTLSNQVTAQAGGQYAGAQTGPQFIGQAGVQQGGALANTNLTHATFGNQQGQTAGAFGGQQQQPLIGSQLFGGGQAGADRSVFPIV